MENYSSKALGEQLRHTGAIKRLSMRHHSDDDFEERRVPRFRMTHEELRAEDLSRKEQTFIKSAEKVFRNLKGSIVHGLRQRKLSA